MIFETEVNIRNAQQHLSNAYSYFLCELENDTSMFSTLPDHIEKLGQLRTNIDLYLASRRKEKKHDRQ